MLSEHSEQRKPSLESGYAGHYIPSPWGWKFHCVNDNGVVIDELLCGGSAGPGKTVVLLRDPLFQMQREHQRCLLPKDHPHHIRWGESVGYALLLRRTTPMIEELWTQSFHVFPKWDPLAKPNAKTMTWTFQSGYRYQFGHCNDVDDWMRYVGNAKTWVGFDELTHFEFVQYDNIKTWLRTSDPVLMHDLKCRAASNPVFIKPKNEDFTVSDPQWVRKHFVDPEEEGNVVLHEEYEYNGEKYINRKMYLPARLTDNPDKDFQRSYMKQLVQKPRHVQAALIEANWYVTPGGYFEGKWDPYIHVVAPFHIPYDWPRWRAMDWGYKKPGVILWMTMDPEENVYIYREFQFQEMVVSKVCQEVKRIETGMGVWYAGRSLITGPADTQLWESRGDDGVTKAEVMRRAGIGWVWATKERKDNAQAIADRLVDYDDYNTLPGLMIFRSCVQTRRYFPNIQSDPKDIEMPLKGGMDHHFETVGYGVRYAERGAAGIPHHEAARAALERGDDDYNDYGPDGYGGY